MEFNLVEFNGEQDQGVDARELHEQLEVSSKFADWIKNRIDGAQLMEHQDFYSLSKNLENGGRTKDYIISIDAAKHIAMLERNDIGRKVRQYFIEIEKRARAINNTQATDPILASLQSIIQVREQQLIDSKRIDHIEQLIDRDDKCISVIGWINIKKLPKLYKGESAQIGKVLTKFAKADGVEPVKVPDARWGETNAYPKEFMAEYFEFAYKQVIGGRKSK